MMIGAALLLIALVMRSAIVNPYVRSRLLISALLFGAYAAASALIAYGCTPDIIPKHPKMWSLVKAASDEAAEVMAGKHPWLQGQGSRQLDPMLRR